MGIRNKSVIGSEVVKFCNIACIIILYYIYSWTKLEIVSDYDRVVIDFNPKISGWC